MLIWTVMDPLAVGGGAAWPPPDPPWPGAPSASDPEGAGPVVLSLGGGRQALCRREPDGRLRLERLLSTDPADFLRPEWVPGARL